LARGRQAPGVEPGKAQKLQECVRDGEPVGFEVLVADFAGLDAG
jgi:hypothetical protein